MGWSNDVALFLGPRLSGYSGVDLSDLTRVEVESRRRMVAHLDHFRRHAPAFEKRLVDAVGPADRRTPHAARRPP